MTNAEPWKGEHHWVSRYDFEEVDGPSVPLLDHPVSLYDVTLRDGEQTPGVVFRTEDKVAIARKLDEVGVPRLEAGFPVVSEEDRVAVKAIAHLGLSARVFGFGRLLLEDIDAARACDVEGIVCEGPVGVPKLKQFDWPPEDVIGRAVRAIDYAKSHGLYTVFFGVDTTRGDWEFLRRVFGAVVEKARPDALAVVDTFGASSPDGYARIVRRFVREFSPLPIEVHTHNDFGLAVATSLAGALAGASVIHASVNGLGERTGNAPLEHVALALELLYGVPSSLRLEKFAELSHVVAEHSGVPLPANYPVVGARAFTRESGISVAGWARYHLGSEAYSPELVGNRYGVVVGKKSGRHAIEYKLSELGLALPADRIEEVVRRVKARAESERRFLTDDEFRAIVEACRAGA
ncbi:MAG: LeuA family protein [Thermoplasmata archaeon]